MAIYMSSVMIFILLITVRLVNEASVCCVAAAGSTLRVTCALLAATLTRLIFATAASACGWLEVLQTLKLVIAREHDRRQTGGAGC